MSAATVPLALMAVAAPLGLADVLYYHLWKFRLYARPASRAETVTHLVRGVLFAAVAVLLASFELRGTWYFAVGLLMTLDFANSVLDVFLEPRSREALGGVPRWEYMIHIVGATLTGGVTAAWMVAARPLADLPTALVPASDIPLWLRANAMISAGGGILLTMVEAGLLLHAVCFHRNRPAPSVLAA